MTYYKKLPYFSYILTSPTHEHFGCILAKDVLYHRVVDFNEFYRALGYNKNALPSDMLPDEFVWHTYIRQTAAKPSECLQAKISGYLHAHSKKFQEEFGQIFTQLLGSCRLEKMDDGELCVACPMHPGIREK
jgi:hypothetical protein